MRAHSERHQTAHAVNFLTISDNGEQEEYAGSGSRYVAQHRRARRRHFPGDRLAQTAAAFWCGAAGVVTKWTVDSGESQNQNQIYSQNTAVLSKLLSG